MPHRGYKGKEAASQREVLVGGVCEQFPDLGWNGYQEMCVRDDNALDAVLAALLAREVERGNCEPPPERLREVVSREGWIWLPSSPSPRDPASASAGGTRG